jgi:uncharacterized membrane protein
METRENAGLVLRTFDIQTFDGIANWRTFLDNINNDCGTIESNGQYLVFKNINMRHVLGTLYDKYDMFNISLRTYLSAPNTTPIAINNAACSIWMTGLSWVNQTYNVKTKTFTTECCIGGCNFLSSTTNGQVTHHSSNTAMFRKGPPDVVDLVIELKNSLGTLSFGADGRLEKIANDLGHQQYIFDFYGVDGYETDRTKTTIPAEIVMSYDKNKQDQLNTPNYLGNNKSFR